MNVIEIIVQFSDSINHHLNITEILPKLWFSYAWWAAYRIDFVVLILSEHIKSFLPIHEF